MRIPTKQSVDAVVQAAIANLQDGRSVEDDSGIELKREWPDPAKKARQLAAAANTLRGDVLVYVIGADDKTGDITTPARREPQDWYAQVGKQFDQIAPGLLWCQTVFCGPDSASVQVLVFDTSEFPYVVKTGMNDILEVPYRRGTATRSARRSDLIRMFDPAIVVPRLEISTATVQVDWKSGSWDPAGPHLRVEVEVPIYVEHLGDRPVTLPVRGMKGRLTWLGGNELDVERIQSEFTVEVPANETAPAQFGVDVRAKHVTATAPGEFVIRSTVFLPWSDTKHRTLEQWQSAIEGSGALLLELAIPISGSDTTARLSQRLIDWPFSPEEFEMVVSEDDQPVGRWTMPSPVGLPWRSEPA